MLEKINRLIEIVQKHPKEEIEKEYVLSDSIQYEFEKLYEDSTRLSVGFRIEYSTQLHIDDIRSIRNRVAHDYESVSIRILFDTIENDLPKLKQDIESFIKKEQ